MIEMAGSDRVPDPNDSKRALGWKRANQLRERNGALPWVLAEVCSKTFLTPPTLLEMGILLQLSARPCIPRWVRD